MFYTRPAHKGGARGAAKKCMTSLQIYGAHTDTKFFCTSAAAQNQAQNHFMQAKSQSQPPEWYLGMGWESIEAAPPPPAAAAIYFRGDLGGHIHIHIQSFVGHPMWHPWNWLSGSGGGGITEKKRVSGGLQGNWNKCFRDIYLHICIMPFSAFFMQFSIIHRGQTARASYIIPQIVVISKNIPAL